MLKVIGIGSPFGDDRVGLLLIEQLRQATQLQSFLENGVELIALDRPGPNLLSHFEGLEKLLLIDAVVTGGQVGELHHWRDVAELENSCSSVSSHGLGLAQTLALARQLAMLPQQLHILGVEIDPAENGSEISPMLEQKIPFLSAQLVEVISVFYT